MRGWAGWRISLNMCIILSKVRGERGAMLSRRMGVSPSGTYRLADFPFRGVPVLTHGHPWPQMNSIQTLGRAAVENTLPIRSAVLFQDFGSSGQSIFIESVLRWLCEYHLAVLADYPCPCSPWKEPKVPLLPRCLEYFWFFLHLTCSWASFPSGPMLMCSLCIHTSRKSTLCLYLWKISTYEKNLWKIMSLPMKNLVECRVLWIECMCPHPNSYVEAITPSVASLKTDQ